MQKKICLITGGTEGVGRVTAMELARKGFTVVIAARNAAKAEAVKREIQISTGNTDADYLIADLKSLQQVRQLANTFKQRYGRIDVLMNNAGIVMPEREITEDGYESAFQVNYLSHFLLTHLLLDDLKQGKQGRIINLSSNVYTMGRFAADNLQSEKRFSIIGAYAASKLFMLMFTIELAKRLSGTSVTANALHPGIVRTNIMLKAPPGLFRLISYMAFPFSISPQKGAETSVHLASSPDVSDVSGKYFSSSKVKEIRTKFNTEDDRDSLWQLSMKSLGKVGQIVS